MTRRMTSKANPEDARRQPRNSQKRRNEAVRRLLLAALSLSRSRKHETTVQR